MTIAERLKRKTLYEPNTGCHLWDGALNLRGYGSLSIDGHRELAHRVAFALVNGPIEPKMTIDHLCRTPGCINPAHLEAVSQRENTMRGNTITARNARATHCIRGHPFDEVNCYVYPATGKRACRRCNNDSHLRRKGRR